MTGHMLNERLGKWTFWIFMSGFNICFFPMYFLGLDGMTRRMYTYSESLGWGWLNQIASVGAVMMGIGFLLLCYNVIWVLVTVNVTQLEIHGTAVHLNGQLNLLYNITTSRNFLKSKKLMLSGT